VGLRERRPGDWTSEGGQDGDVGPDDGGMEDGGDDGGVEDGPGQDEGGVEDGGEDGEATDAPDDGRDVPDVEAYDAGRRCTEVATGWSFNGSVGSWSHDEIDGTGSGAWDPWEHGLPTGGPGSCRTGGATNRCWSTGLAGTYPTCQRAALRSPTVDLSPCATSPLRVDVVFWQWFAFGSGSGSTDGGTVEITSDGGSTWVALAPEEGWSGTIDMDLGAGAGCTGTMYPDGRDGFTGSSGTWIQRTVRIPAEHRTADFAFRFVFGSDGVTGGQGWFIDDVSVVAH